MYSYLMQKPDHDFPAIYHGSAPHQSVSLGAALCAAFDAGLRRWKQKRTIVALEALDDRILSDIGLSRGGISAAVVGSDLQELGMAPSTGRYFTQEQPRALAA